MTAQNECSQSALLSQIIQKYNGSSSGTIYKRNLALLSNHLEKWGDFVVYDQPELRQLVSESIAHRLALSKKFVSQQMNLINGIRRRLWG